MKSEAEQTHLISGGYAGPNVKKGRGVCSRGVVLKNPNHPCSLDDKGHLLIVEGAGGIYSPLAENGLNADLASLLQLTVIIVVDDRIGAVNQALMTIQAVESRHLPIAAVILNQVSGKMENDMNNAEDLQSHCSYPVFCCRHNQKLEPVFK